MFEGSSTVNIFELRRDLITVNLGNIVIHTKHGERYTGVYAVCRLLSLEEIRRIDTVRNDAPIVHDSLEESIVRACLTDMLGMNKDDIDFDNSDAGLVPRIANAVIVKSLGILNDPIRKVASLEDEISIIENMGAIVSRYLNIPYTSVIELPINKLLRYFSICKKTFPSEVNFGEASNNFEDD